MANKETECGSRNGKVFRSSYKKLNECSLLSYSHLINKHIVQQH